MLYAADIAVQALSLEAQGSPWQGRQTVCACCGKPVLPGDIAVRDKDRFGAKFNDGPSLVAKGSGAVCGACSSLFSAAPLRALQCTLLTPEGAYPIARDSHRSWFLLTPPEPPWVAVVSDTKQAHLVWKTPVTLDNRLMIVRVGQRLLRIRRPILEQAIADAQFAADALNLIRLRKKKTIKEGLRHPFKMLARDMEHVDFGQLHPLLMSETAALEHEGLAPVLDRLRRLGQGELWALATLVKMKREVPEKPSAIVLGASAQSDELLLSE